MSNVNVCVSHSVVSEQSNTPLPKRAVNAGRNMAIQAGCPPWLSRQLAILFTLSLVRPRYCAMHTNYNSTSAEALAPSTSSATKGGPISRLTSAPALACKLLTQQLRPRAGKLHVLDGVCSTPLAGSRSNAAHHIQHQSVSLQPYSCRAIHCCSSASAACGCVCGTM